MKIKRLAKSILIIALLALLVSGSVYFADYYVGNEVSATMVTASAGENVPDGEPEPHKDNDMKSVDNKASGDETPALTDQQIGREIADFAEQFLGYRYVGGGSNPYTGFDCSGFVQYVLNSTGHYLSARSCTDQYYSTWRVSADELMPGDIVFFTGTWGNAQVTHVGIYIGGGRMIHAGDENSNVCHANLWEDYWVSHIYGYGRIR